MRKTSKIILVTIIATSILLGLGYAAIQNITLNITGTAAAQISQDNFKVRFVGMPVVSDAVNVTANINNDTTASINVTGLTERGQVVTAIYEIENQSEDLSSDLKINTTNSNTEYFRVSSKLEEMSLVAGDKTTVTVTVEMLKTPIEESVSSNVGVKLEAMPVEPGKEGTSEGTNDFSQTPDDRNEYGFYFEEAYSIDVDDRKVSYVFIEDGSGALLINSVLHTLFPSGTFSYSMNTVSMEGEPAYFSSDGKVLILGEVDALIAYLDDGFMDKFININYPINEYGFYFDVAYSVTNDDGNIGSIIFRENNTIEIYENDVLSDTWGPTDVSYAENQAIYDGFPMAFEYLGKVVKFNEAILAVDFNFGERVWEEEE